MIKFSTHSWTRLRHTRLIRDPTKYGDFSGVCNITHKINAKIPRFKQCYYTILPNMRQSLSPLKQKISLNTGFQRKGIFLLHCCQFRGIFFLNSGILRYIWIVLFALQLLYISCMFCTRFAMLRIFFRTKINKNSFYYIYSISQTQNLDYYVDFTLVFKIPLLELYR